MDGEFICAECGGRLEPVMFTERETKIVNNHLIETGRIRLNCDYLLCSCCGNTEAVDDLFAGPWYTVSELGIEKERKSN